LGCAIAYLLRDEFTTALGAGSVNGTNAEPGPGVRTVVDTENKLTINASGQLAFSGGKAAPAYGDPGLWESIQTRVAGKMLFAQLTIGIVNKNCLVGFDNDQSVALAGEGLRFGTTLDVYIGGGGTASIGGQPTNGSVYYIAQIMRASGQFILVKIGTGNWLFYYCHPNSNANRYPCIQNYDSTNTCSFLRVPLALWLPTPLLSDGMGSTFGTSDGLGHAEGIAGGLGAGGSGPIWNTAGTWATAGGVVANTPVLGTEILTNTELTTNTNGWVASGDATIARVDSEIDPGTNSGGADKWALKVTVGATGGSAGGQNITPVVGAWAYLQTRAYAPSANTRTNAARVLFNNSALSLRGQVTAEDAWQGIYCIDRLTAGSTQAFCSGTGAGGAYTAGDNSYFDTPSLKYLPISTLITNQLLSTTDVLAEMVISAYTLGTQVGIVQSDRPFAFQANANAAAGQNVIVLKGVTNAIPDTDTITIKHPITPTTYTIASVSALAGGIQTLTLDANLVEAVSADDMVGVDWASWNGSLHYFDGAGNLKIDEILAGVYTNRESAVKAFSAAARLIVRKIGSEYRLFYNEALIGTESAVDAGAMTGLYWGMFSTLVANTITSFVVYDTGNTTNAYSTLDKYSRD
jgi:hypothetical protein